MIDRILLGAGLLVCLGAPLASAQEPTEPLESPHWAYEGDIGPEAWGALDGAYELCSVGTQQSPVDIDEAVVVTEDLDDLEFLYQPSTLTLVNNGHTVQANYDAGSQLVVNGHPYDLLQVHFHTPSEHSLNGEMFDAEAHFVHRDAEGKGFLAVVGVFIRVGEENPAFTEVLANAPEEGQPETFSELINAAQMLPADTSTYRYLGSLTTPPCSQGVRWNVLAEPITMSQEQLGRLAELMGKNNRPLQTLGERRLVRDTAE